MEAYNFTKEAKKALIERNMTVKDLADELGFSRTYISIVLNGKLINEDIKAKIGAYLNISTV